MELVNEGKDRVLIPEDTYAGVCIRIIDLGTQVHKKYGPKRKINLAYELDETDDEGNPYIAYRNFTAAITPKSHLAKAIKSWTGTTIKKGDTFDLDSLLGQPCMITIVHSEPNDDDEVYANIDSITKLPKSMKAFKPSNDTWSLYLDDTFDKDLFKELPEYLQEKIQETDEYKALGKGSSKKKSRKVEDEEEEEEQPRRKRGKAVEEEEEQPKRKRKPVVEEEEEEEEQPKPKRGKKVVEEEEEEEDDTPRRKRKPVVEEEEEEEEEDTPPRRRRR